MRIFARDGGAHPARQLLGVARGQGHAEDLGPVAQEAHVVGVALRIVA